MECKLHLFGRTQRKFILIQFASSKFSLYLGHPQACEYKNLLKKDIIKSKGSIVYRHWYLLCYNKEYKKDTNKI
jgi:hypothetical protein